MSELFTDLYLPPSGPAENLCILFLYRMNSIGNNWEPWRSPSLFVIVSCSKYLFVVNLSDCKLATVMWTD